MMDVKRGDIFFADFSTDSGAEERPVVVVQNDMGNKYSRYTIVAEMPEHLSQKVLPTHVVIPSEISKLGKDTLVMTEHLITIEKDRMKRFITRVSDEYMEEIDRALKISLSLD